MHELGIVYQIIKTTDEIKKEQKLTDIETIVLEIGEMSGVVPKYIEQAWQTVRESTGYGKTQMKIETVPARAKCRSCGYTDFVRKLDIDCPQCNSQNFEIISGREFLIKEIIIK